MKPPSLKELFGDRFRVTYDDAMEARNDPWMMQIRCRGQRVTIYPHGEGILAVECDNRPRVARLLAGLGLRLHQDGDREKTFLCPVDRFQEVAAIVKPLRRPVLSEEQRADLAARITAINTRRIGLNRAKFASGPSKAT